MTKITAITIIKWHIGIAGMPDFIITVTIQDYMNNHVIYVIYKKGKIVYE